MNGSYKVRLPSKIFPKLMGVQVLVEMFVIHVIRDSLRVTN